MQSGLFEISLHPLATSTDIHHRYLQFHPVVYLLKLHIEMKMADLISKVVRASNINDQLSHFGSNTQTHIDSSQLQHDRSNATMSRTHTKIVQDDEIELTRGGSAGQAKESGTTAIVRSDHEEDRREEEDYIRPRHVECIVSNVTP